MRIIDADFVKQRIKETMLPDYVYSTRRINNEIDAAPTIDAEPVRHGKWLYSRQYGTYCSECGAAAFEIVGEQYSKLHTRYCWECGAKMDEVTT